jgi:hypothetical protein
VIAAAQAVNGLVVVPKWLLKTRMITTELKVQ